MRKKNYKIYYIYIFIYKFICHRLDLRRVAEGGGVASLCQDSHRSTSEEVSTHPVIIVHEISVLAVTKDLDEDTAKLTVNRNNK